MKPVNPIKSILHNFFGILGHYKSLASFIKSSEYTKKSIRCYVFHSDSALEKVSEQGTELYRCQKCGILWVGRKKVEKK